MTPEPQLNQVADRYRAQGYAVVLHPGPKDLPEFAKDFRVEILATRGDGGVLASVKKDRLDLQADRELPRYAEVTGNQPGWRLDLFVLGAESQPEPDGIEGSELTDEDIVRALNEVERMREGDFRQPAFIAAWAVLETAMRRRLLAEGEEVGRGSSPRSMLNELYSSGVLSVSDFRDLERLFKARSAIVHGFVSPEIASESISFLVETARRLLDESRAAAQAG